MQITISKYAMRISVELNKYTGWPKKVSHYQMIKNGIISY